jgi:hypothetical protein
MSILTRIGRSLSRPSYLTINLKVSDPLPKPNPQRPDLLPAIILLAIVVLFCAVVWLFPYIQGFVERENCIAVGRVDCG